MARVSPWNSDSILREELFSIERLEQHATSLAMAQQTTPRPARRPALAVRLDDNEATLFDAYRTIVGVASAGRAITPAAEWLLDNYHLVEEQIREIRKDLPPGYYRQLPKLASGPFTGYPRVLGIAWAFVAHTDSHFEPESLRRFVRAYQRVQPLTIGELWAVAITLRMVLVENLRRAGQRIVSGRIARQQADDVADRLLGMNGRAPEPDALLRLHADDPELPRTFLVQLVQRLREQDPKVTPSLAWLEEWLLAQGMTAEVLVHAEHQRQGGSNVTVRNIITSMRLISEFEWSEFFESVSLVDEALREGSDFSQMDFATRNLYRSGIEELARGSKQTELQIAQAALAAASPDSTQSPRERDPGFHLIGRGRDAFERIIDYRAPLLRRPLRWLLRRGPLPYIGAIIALALLILAFALRALPDTGWNGPGMALLGMLGLVPALDAAIALVNRAVTRWVGPTILPGLSLRDGVPASLRTLIAVPMLLTSTRAIEEQVERLEIHFLTSPEGELHFALLTDWVDAPLQNMPDDMQLLATATRGIDALNLRHPSPGRDQRFLLLHRRRLWCPTQRQWMGWERKRGKLHELNALLRGSQATSYRDIAGDVPVVPVGVRYVITLDADTRLPRECVRRLIGKLSHPLNRPGFDAAGRRVIDGYGILQPRVTPSLPTGREGSLFQRIVSTAPGLDPYASAVSDVYQDLFGEGSYAGKGIYDIDAFESALAGRAAEGMLLSHDLFEGIFARAGLASDIEVVEEYPTQYDVAAARQHRWARGDWQLLPWLLGRRDTGDRDPARSRVTPIGAWKMLDNLRRTLSAPLTLLALSFGWTLPLQAALPWTAFILGTLAIPNLLPVVAALAPRSSGITLRSHLRALALDFWQACLQFSYQLVFLAEQAWLMSDAIGRTLFRLFVSRRNLLEWITAAQAAMSRRLDLPGAFRGMLGGVAASLVVASVALVAHASGGSLAAPFVALWLAAPAIAVWISRAPSLPARLTLSPTDADALRLVARRTWRYFETFVTSEDQMLPPDNFQEDPREVLAHRTSPTNLGLYLLSIVSARDFGWIGTSEALDRLEATLATMERMQRFRGHFLNWYDTRDLRPLEPRYVSTVDSGNLAAHLMTVAHACREWIDMPSSAALTARGAGDALRLAREARRALAQQAPAPMALWRPLDARLAALDAALQLPATGRNSDGAGQLDEAATQAATLVDLGRIFATETGEAECVELTFWLQAIHASISSGRHDAVAPVATSKPLATRLMSLTQVALAMAEAMEFDFLLDPQRRLLAIGYRVGDATLDPSCYDLLASEARLASFVAIAKGDVASRHWFRLGRPVTPIGSGSALVSWSGSMFEYLMPSLVMRAPVGSLLEQTSRLIVRRQMEYAELRGLPWGISESAYHARDLELTYQYSNFGVPGLGLKRGLGENAVVAPYATALAAMVDPQRAAQNFTRLAALGALGRHGFHEAIDYTRSRVPDDARFVIVRAFMAHHQGMTIVALANVLLRGVARRRFHSDPRVRATELLLQERTPREVSVAQPRAEEIHGNAPVETELLPDARRFHSANDVTPQVHLLSNGHYAAMVTAAGSGYSRWRDFGITRWREDLTCDDTGSYIFLRDAQSGRVWSATYQPCAGEPASYDVTFSEDRAEFQRIDADITTTLEIVVSPEDDAEVRRLSITNTSGRARDLEVTSYAELVLAPVAADAAHPAFSKIFVQTEYLERLGALLATRRRRTPDEAEIWAGHHAVLEGAVAGAIEVETDRARFVGRGHGACAPVVVMDGRRLSGTVGTVLDPIFALRYRLRVEPGAIVRIAFWTAVAASREDVLNVLDKHQDSNSFVRASTLAWTQAQVQLRHLGITAAEASLFQRIAGHLIHADGALRPSSDTIARGSGPPAELWSQGISGDLPIVLLRIDAIEDIAIVRQLLQAHEYWHLKQLAVDLVILNERGTSYVEDLQAGIETLVRTSQSRGTLGSTTLRGAVFVLRSDRISIAARALLSSVARAVFIGQRGSLIDQVDRARKPANSRRRTRPPRVLPTRNAPTGPTSDALEFFNGLGGFTSDGREYVTLLGPGQATPAPWINVVANAGFGFQVSTEGSGFTWALNSKEYQLTAWSNDPVSDRPGDAFYLRDKDNGDLWSPTAAPTYDPAAYHAVHHGQGYSRFEHDSHGVALDLLVFVPLDDPLRISRLRIHNSSGRQRRLTLTSYVEWVLGNSRSTNAPHIITSIDAETGALFARNPWNATFGTRIAFTDLAGRQTDWTADRREFIGRHGTLAEPAALFGTLPFSQRVGAGLDPCGVLQASIVLAPGETTDIVSFLGDAADVAQAQAMLKRYREADLEAVFRQVVAHWEDVLGAVQVRTPDRSMDVILNRWALYQTLACRMWARSAFYQASGAFGFRDQLQDGMALAVARPAITRSHLLRAAARQFVEGDVQHWWLPPTGQGVRTRTSDDRIWLVYATAHYVATTGDTHVLDALVPFLDGQALRPGESDVYFQPGLSDQSASLLEHCVRALDLSLALGAHGLPLIGTGDWNDGMNRVGEQGRGESTWLGWFLYATIHAFAPLARSRGAAPHAARWLAHAAGLKVALEDSGWDGEWYRRGYFDDGTPLGSATSDECRIDSIAQSWSVLSGAGETVHATRAMAALDRQLIRHDPEIALLFTPPFDRSLPDPGYIKSYPPGIRENGGQYTHAATWSVMAFAQLGQAEQAAKLFALLNPINQTRTRAAVHRYKVEPYAIAADVYSVMPHVGRGGWTWYTGSAGWMYRAGLESILGFRLQGAELLLAPCIPAHWPRFEIDFRYHAGRYEIVVENPDRVSSEILLAELDGEPLTARPLRIPLAQHAAIHSIRLTLGRASAAPSGPAVPPKGAAA